MKLPVYARLVGLWASMAAAVGGCTSISVAPSCPSELAVGESGTVQANEKQPGAIPTYKWEATPSDAVTFEDDSAPTTTIEAVKTGEVVVRLKASDSLYQVISECRVTIVEPVDVEVSLTVEPDPAIVGDSAILYCRSVGEAVAVTLTLEQTDGATVTMSPVAEGVATFTPTEAGELTFSCVGATEGGSRSEPSVVTISVEEASDDNANVSDNVNDNANDNRNDNAADNGNDNTSRRPGGRPGGGG